jgi:NADH-quinone oxidoreductase subunit M
LLPQPFLERLRPSAERFVARATVGLPGAAGSEALVRMEIAQRDEPAGAIAPIAAPLERP